MKDKLTVLIPLKGREHCTTRILDQLSKDKCPFSVVLADGGGSDLSDKWGYPSLNLEYYYFGEDITVNTFMKKMHTATSFVKTPYIMFADNDDLICIDGVLKALEFLDNNPEYVSFRGALTEQKDGHNFHTYPHSIEHSSVYFNVCQDLAAKDAAWQDITRTEPVRKLYRLLYKSGTEDLMLTFTMDSGFRLLYGYNKKDFDITTTYHISGEGMVLNRSDWLGYKGWMNYGDIYHSLGLFVSVIANGVNKYGGRLLEPTRFSFAEYLLNDIYDVAINKGVCINTIKEEAIKSAISKSRDFDTMVRSVI
jgi:glycosyltransferase domain-containing protein